MELKLVKVFFFKNMDLTSKLKVSKSVDTLMIGPTVTAGL